MPRDGNEIGQPAKVVRRKRAILGPASKIGTPASANTAAAETPMRRRRARNATTPGDSVPVVNPIGSASNDGAGGEGQSAIDNLRTAALAEIIAELASLQRRRKFCITAQSRADRSIESMIAGTMGFRIDADEKDRKKLFSAAKAHRLAVEKGGEGQLCFDTHEGGALSAIAPLILASAENRKTWDVLRDAVEKDMRKLARVLPVYEFAKSVLGFGDLALAVIVAEAGIPLGDYRTVAGLWKRMGLAVFGGERQQRKRDKTLAELHGYSPRRRSQVWSFCSDSMFRHQYRGAKPAGPYGEVYARRRFITEPRIADTADLPAGDQAKWTKARCYNDARRIMTKALLRDLWRVWRGLPPRGANEPTLADCPNSPIYSGKLAVHP